VQYVTSLRRDGSTHLLLDPLELIEKLSVLIPPPRFHLLRFHGVLAPRAQLRSDVVLRSSRDAELGGGQAPSPSLPDPRSGPSSGAGRLGRLSWAALMRRVFEVDVLLCSRCGGRRRSVAVSPGGQRLRDLLDRLGLSQPPGLPPPQGFPDLDAAK
jgi:hypothetical protein